jgi:ferric-dicitrate binding protein FerR (iron transport regulator)
MDIERYRHLLMAHLDGEIEPSEAEELERAIAEHPELREELSRMEQLGRRLSGIRIKDPADDVIEELGRTLIKQVGLPIGWLLVMGGVLLFLAWFGWSWWQDPEIPAVLRWTGSAVFLGLLLLFLVKVRERWIERRGDPYRDVLR